MKKQLCRLLSATNANSKMTDLAFVLLRLFVGLSMGLTHGLAKMPPPQMLIDGVAGLGFPMPVLFAWAAALSEFVGGLLVAAGLLTRPAAAFISITMLVAVFGAHGADTFDKKEMALLYFFTMAFFALAGAGRWSLDHVISRRCQK